MRSRLLSFCAPDAETLAGTDFFTFILRCAAALQLCAKTRIMADVIDSMIPSIKSEFTNALS